MITKSQFIYGRKCFRQLYLSYHKIDAPPPDSGGQRRIAAGERINVISRTRYPGGIKVPQAYRDNQKAAEETAHLMTTDAEAIFEATFLSEEALARIDILERTPTGWRIIEVKSSSKVKDEHVEDVAFQLWLLRRLGIPVESVWVEVVNKAFVLGDEEINATNFLAREDVTARASELAAQYDALFAEMQAVVAQETAPERLLVKKCDECFYAEVCLDEIPKDAVFRFPGMRSNESDRLRKMGVERIGEIPLSEVKENQHHIIFAHQNGRPFVSPTLSEELGKLQWPLICVDFEALMRAEPWLRGTAAYEAIPFQWSVHIMQNLDDEPEHFDYLHTDGTDPRVEFTRTLRQVIAQPGTILFYSAYENTTLKKLAKDGIPLAAEVHDAFTSRGCDLLKLVRDNIYLREFNGSFSIKAVLPGLLKDNPYKRLNVANGEEAMAAYERLISGTLPPGERDSLIEDMLAYCKMDTYAMVELIRALHALA